MPSNHWNQENRNYVNAIKAMRHIIMIPVNAIETSTANIDHAFIGTSVS